MRLIERRVGLVFALFLLGLGIAATKALWLGVVRANTLRGVANTQQFVEIFTLPMIAQGYTGRAK